MRIRATLTVLGLTVAAAILIYLIYRVPILLAADDFGGLGPKERLDAIAAARTQLATLIGTPIAVAGLVYTVRRFLLDKEKQDVDRFSAVVTHLASDDPVTRSGGVFALQRLMEDAPRERDRGRRLLARHLQQRTKNGEFATAPGDLVDAVAVLRSQVTGRNRAVGLDLAGVRLPKADLRGAGLPEADLDRAELTGANLTGVNLRGADLSHANLSGADLRDSDLRDAVLRGTRFHGARLGGANLIGAEIAGAVFTAADLAGARLRGLDRSLAIGLAADEPAESAAPATS
ncbi:pentapeptide repeat-containing protein [Nocardia sp. NPDC058176]|uniref:pentapeptide repeat-containing protein n=1 Tax=Nocardia sp. NPDC058176 TaxID=3346368 RepID=UPI0036DE58B8